MGPTLTELLSQRISARCFGAVGDGATDDTAAIAAGILALYNAGGGTLYFPRGTYIWTAPITLYDNVNLEGEGYASCIKVGPSVANYNNMFSHSSALHRIQNVTVSNLRFDHNQAQNGVTPGLVSGNLRETFRIYNPVNVTVENCYFDWCGTRSFHCVDVDAYGLDRGSGITLLNNWFNFTQAVDGVDYDCSAIYVDVPDHIIEGNRLYDNGQNAHGGIETHAGPGVVIGNTIKGYRTGVHVEGDTVMPNVVLDHTFTPADPDEAAWILGAGWSINAGGYALRAAGAVTGLSQTIPVYENHKYRIVWTMTRTSGAGSLTVSIGGTAGTAHTDAGPTTYTEDIVAGATGVLVFTPTSDFAGTVDEVHVRRFYDEGTNIVVANNSIFDALQAILLWSGNDQSLRNVLISGNTIHLNNADRPAAAPFGALAKGIAWGERDPSGSSENIEIVNNIIRLQKDERTIVDAVGIEINVDGNVSNVLIQGNTIIDAPRQGVLVFNPGDTYENISILDNTLVDCGNDSTQDAANRCGVKVSGVLPSVWIARNRVIDTGSPVNGYYAYFDGATAGSLVRFAADNKTEAVAGLSSLFSDYVADMRGWNVLTYPTAPATAVAVNFMAGEIHYLGLTGNNAHTFSAPTAGSRVELVAGRKLTIIVENLSGAATAVAGWNAAYKWRSGTPLPAIDNLNERYMISFICDGMNWIEVARTETVVP